MRMKDSERSYFLHITSRNIAFVLLTIFQFTDLTVLLLEFLTDLLHWDVVAERLGHLVDYLGGCVTCCPDVVTLDM